MCCSNERRGLRNWEIAYELRTECGTTLARKPYTAEGPDDADNGEKQQRATNTDGRGFGWRMSFMAFKAFRSDYSILH